MKLDKTLVGLAIAAGTALAPMAAHAEPTSQMRAAETPTEAAQIKAVDLRKALASGASRDELVKCITFPKGMPVNEYGQFDAEQANRIFNASVLASASSHKAFKKYMAAVEKGTNPDIAFQRFAYQLTNGNKAQMKQLHQMKHVLQKVQKEHTSGEVSTRTNQFFGLLGLVAMLGLTLGPGVRQLHKKVPGLLPTIAVAGSVALGAYFGSSTSLRRLYVDVSRQMYNAYVNQEIQKAAGPEVQKGEEAPQKITFEHLKLPAPKGLDNTR